MDCSGGRWVVWDCFWVSWVSCLEGIWSGSINCLTCRLCLSSYLLEHLKSIYITRFSNSCKLSTVDTVKTLRPSHLVRKTGIVLSQSSTSFYLSIFSQLLSISWERAAENGMSRKYHNVAMKNKIKRQKSETLIPTVLWLLLDFLFWKIMLIRFLLASWRSMRKIAGFGSGSTPKCHGSGTLILFLFYDVRVSEWTDNAGGGGGAGKVARHSARQGAKRSKPR